MDAELKSILRCPRCQSALSWADDAPRCENDDCRYADKGFPCTQGQPVLIDFAQSIFDRDAYAQGPGGAAIPRTGTGLRLKERLKEFAAGPNRMAMEKAPDMVARARDMGDRPRILVIGGGRIGSGADALYRAGSVHLIGTDVYASPDTDLVCDGHQLPFADGCIDAIWIQAVLEHVLSPHIVAGEIERVLKPGGLVYADTPFMQPVHEKAYDFTRFSLSGQRWLFRNFEQIDAGAVGGAGTALISAIRYFARAISGSDKLATLASLPFFWLRFFDRIARTRPNIDAASGTFFYGRKSGRALQPSQMVAYYEGQRTPAGRGSAQ